MTPAEAAKQLEIDVNQLVLEINANARGRAFRGLNIIRNATLEVLGHDGNGRVYKRGKKGFHVASSPGSPPAPDWGNLRKNWRRGSVLAFPNGKGLGVRIHMRRTSDMLYAKFLEFGTRRMARRPFHDRIKTKARPSIEALFSSI